MLDIALNPVCFIQSISRSKEFHRLLQHWATIADPFFMEFDGIATVINTQKSKGCSACVVACEQVLTSVWT